MSILKDKLILVVDDEPFLREAIVFELQACSAKTLEAGSGNEALKIVKSRPVDVVLSDMRMPDGDGAFLLNEIKKINPKTPIFLLITGFSNLPEKEIYEKGAAAIITKPFDPENLINQIERVLN